MEVQRWDTKTEEGFKCFKNDEGEIFFEEGGYYHRDYGSKTM